MISGANRGIGKACADHLASLGYQLSLGMRQIENRNNALVCHYDARDADSAKSWVADTLEHYGRIDALVNCAGILRLVDLESDDEAALDEMWDVNVKGSWRLTRAVLPQLRKTGRGRIVQVVSMSGKRVKGLSCGYAISKFAQLALSQCTRNAGWEDGVRTSAICPSWVNTGMIEGVCPLDVDTITQPEDVARATALLLGLPNEAYIGEILINSALESC